jgi:hypothetical protein
MLKDKPRRIGSADQETLARGFFKTALVAADGLGEPKPPRSLYDAFFKERDPVADSRVWLGATPFAAGLRQSDLAARARVSREPLAVSSVSRSTFGDRRSLSVMRWGRRAFGTRSGHGFLSGPVIPLDC